MITERLGRQLGGVHLACERINISDQVLERGRLMAYLEQSTRYIPYRAARDSWLPRPARAGQSSLRQEFITR
jgi:hypothetical protein